MHRARAFAFLALGLFGIAACGDNLDAPPEECANTVDDDLDGFVDCADSDCSADPACLSGPELDCDDTIDNDNDGNADCADSDCAGAANCVPEANCTDGLDDDLDGAIDCADSDCAAAPNCVPEANCMDGLDDDLDGAIDCADSDCAAAPNCNPEGNCGDTIDNDLDGAIDCADTDCTVSCIAGCPVGHAGIQVTATGLPLAFGMSPTAVAASMPVATTGVISGVAVQVDVTHPYVSDADLRLESPSGVITDLSITNGGSGDNYTDTLFVDSAMTDIGAGTAPFTGSFRPDEALAGHIGSAADGTWILHAEDSYPTADDGSLDAVDLYLCVCNGPECEIGLACRDGADNDGDALADCLDPNCATDPFCIPETVCDDGVDNDLDTLTDCLDPSCDGVGSCEFGDETTCDDDVDNDADGDIDCADSQCAAQPLCMAEVDCGDGLDNDTDGVADCLDPGCDGIGICQLDTELTCNDGADNDGDGMADCADADCAGSLFCLTPACPAGTTKTLYSSIDVPVTIVDVGTVTSTISVVATGLVADAAVSIDIAHGWDADLDISLTGPGGSIDLSSDNGGSSDNFIDTVFLDSAAASITTGTAPFTGAFQPEQPFANLYGTPADGDWDLVVTDDEAGITGTVDRYQLVLCWCDPAAGGPCEFGEACRDGVDNDGNGATDCAEAACATDPFCVPEPVCDDTLDNDFDGDTDCEDLDCDGDAGCEFGTELTCTDLFDNDADGLLDCLDPDCPACPAVCGNNDLELGEACDDGDLTSGDGCSATCTVEVGFFCTGDPSVCVPGEIEPNEDGTPQPGGAPLDGNDFDAGGIAVTNANSNGPIDASDGSTILMASIAPAGDEDVFAITNTTAIPHVARFDVWNMATGFGVGVSCGTTSIDTALSLRDAASTLLAQNDDRTLSDWCSRLSFVLSPGQTIYAHVIDRVDDEAIPQYAFQVTFTPIVCGDGFVQAPIEECDDGNLIDTDSCNAMCQVSAQEVEPNNTVANADASPLQISSSALIEGSITPVGDLDLYRVTVAAETVVRIETFVGAVGDCVPSTTLVARLRDSAGTQIIADTATAGIGNCSAMVFTLPAGTFYVQVEETGNNATVAKYFLEVSFTAADGAEAEPAGMTGINETNATAEAVLLSSADSWAFGDHSVDTDVDVWAITVPPGRAIRAEIIEGDRAIETCESFGIDSRLTLIDTLDTVLADDDDLGRGFCSLIDGTGTTPLHGNARNTTSSPQTMFLHVRRSGTITGAAAQFIYRLQVTVR